MSVLLVDIGNTRIKWARLARGRIGRQQAATHAGWSAREFGRQLFEGAADVRGIVVASVAGRAVQRTFTAAARRATGLTPLFIASARTGGGVTTRYAEPWRLGVDRFSGVIGAHALSGERPALVADVGTALTLDLVDARGVHRGGAIVPGPALMVASLLRATSGIGPRARGAAHGRGPFARSTLAAIEHGARFAVAAAIDAAAAEARRTLGARPRVFLTGGAARAVQPLLRTRHEVVPDLVLRGLAVLA
jgi:type III pantothenate kinase